jgi:hypothetical protein
VAVLVSTREYERLHTDRPGFREAFRRFLARQRLPSPDLGKSFIGTLRAKDSGRRVAL